MKSVWALSTIVLSMLIGHAALADSEGRAADLAPKTLEPGRIANYTHSPLRTSTLSQTASPKKHTTRAMKPLARS